MIQQPPLNFGQVAEVAQNGSPLLLQALGRLYGIGSAERRALGQDGMGVPLWAWGGLAFALGAVAGIRLYRAKPEVVPRMISGD